VDLPDGSNIRLNAASDLRFTASEQERLVSLTGEAFFDVTQDGRSFAVQTQTGRVTVLGTSFNVYSRAQILRVSCVTGRVRVSHPGTATDYTLEPGQSVALLADGTTEKSLPSTTEALDWLEGRSTFNGQPLGEVIAELERQFDLEIRTPASLDLLQPMQTGFPHDALDTALQIVFGAIDQLEYQRSGRIVTVSIIQ